MNGKGRIVEHLMADASLPACKFPKLSKAAIECTSLNMHTLCYVKPSETDSNVGGGNEYKCKCPNGKLPKVTETIPKPKVGKLYDISCD